MCKVSSSNVAVIHELQASQRETQQLLASTTSKLVTLTTCSVDSNNTHRNREQKFESSKPTSYDSLPVAPTCKAKNAKRKQQTWSCMQYCQDTVLIVCRDMVSAAFFLDVFAFGVAFAFVELLVFLFFVDELNASYSLCGATVVVTVLFEIPIFYAAPFILKRFSNISLFIVAHLAYIIRVVGYTVAPNVSDMCKFLVRLF
jgi:hypothetical protein